MMKEDHFKQKLLLLPQVPFKNIYSVCEGLPLKSKIYTGVSFPKRQKATNSFTMKKLDHLFTWTFLNV